MNSFIPILLMAIGILMLAQAILIAWLLVALRQEIVAVHTAVNSNLSEAQNKLNSALVKIENLETKLAGE